MITRWPYTSVLMLPNTHCRRQKIFLRRYLGLKSKAILIYHVPFSKLSWMTIPEVPEFKHSHGVIPVEAPAIFRRIMADQLLQRIKFTICR